MPSTIIGRLALGGALGGLLALTGCSAVETNGPAGVVQVTPLSESVVVSQPYCTIDGAGRGATTVMRSAPIADPHCGSFTGFETEAADKTYTSGGGHRLLVAVLVTDGTPAPELALRRRPDVAFAEDPAVLALAPEAPEGRHWVGYRSGEVRFELNEPDAGDVVDATVAIPRTADRPASEALDTTIAIGAQVTGNGFGAEYDAERPVNCAEDLSTTDGAPTPGYDEDLDETTCPFQPGGSYEGAPAPQTTTIVPTDAAITTSDEELPVVAGESVTVPFTVAQSGVVPEPSDLTLSSSTSVPGGQATSSAGSVPWTIPVVEEPGSGTTTGPTPPDDGGTTTEMRTTAETLPTRTETTTVAAAPAARAAAPRIADDSAAVPVTVAVPAGTTPGVYDVTLKAEDEGGSRSATARIRVSAAPVPATPATPAAPAAPVTPAAPRKSISATVKLLRATQVSRRTRRVHLGTVTCVRDAGSCTVRTRVRIGTRTIGTIVRTVGPKSSGPVTLRLTRANLARLIKRSATATTTVSAAESVDIVRTTTVKAKALPRKKR